MSAWRNRTAAFAVAAMSAHPDMKKAATDYAKRSGAYRAAAQTMTAIADALETK